jgi:pimeloyl-ACP methyl ester carboxylesterase
MAEIAQIRWRERDVHLEYEWVRPESANVRATAENLTNAEAPTAEAHSAEASSAQALGFAPSTKSPLWVLLHEGLGSLAMWREFPQQLADCLGCELLVYSRPGYGWSSERPNHEVWHSDFLHQQAHEVLPALLRAVGLQFTDEGHCTTRPLHLLGHSDGASIALLYAAKYKPNSIVLMAPHIIVEDISIDSIKKAKESYETTDLPARLARYHQNADSAFWGWNQVWLSPEFRNWSIGSEIESITCPILAIQGEDDEYGTMLQIEAIAQHCVQTKLLKLSNCKHSPHRDQPQQVMQGVAKFFTAIA